MMTTFATYLPWPHRPLVMLQLAERSMNACAAAHAIKAGRDARAHRHSVNQILDLIDREGSAILGASRWQAYPYAVLAAFIVFGFRAERVGRLAINVDLDPVSLRTSYHHADPRLNLAYQPNLWLFLCHFLIYDWAFFLFANTHKA